MAVLIGAFVVMAGVAVAVGLATGTGDKATVSSQTGNVEVTGRALPAFGSGTNDLARGLPAPELRGAGFDGRGITVAADGTPKLVIFVAHWCPHCQAEVPRVVDWLAGGAPQDVRLVAVSTGVDPNRPNYPPSSWLEREGWTIPTIADDAGGTAGTAFGLSGYPFFVAVTKDGTVAARASGEQTVQQLEALVRAARG
jgi:thiol-disulfide isomerase/thioredoxin